MFKEMYGSCLCSIRSVGTNVLTKFLFLDQIRGLMGEGVVRYRVVTSNKAMSSLEALDDATPI